MTKPLENKCKRCGTCCANFNFSLRLPDNEKRIEKFLLRRNKYPHGYWHMDSDGTIHIRIPVPCELLKDKNVCTVHDTNKPELCRIYVCEKMKKEG